MTRTVAWPRAIRQVLMSVLGPDGRSAQSERQSVYNFALNASGVGTDDTGLPETLKTYIEKLTHSPYKILDRDVDALRDAGYSEDQIYEITIANALGAAAGRYQRTMELLNREIT